MKTYREDRAELQLVVKRGNNSGAAGCWQVTLGRVGILMVLRHGPGFVCTITEASRVAVVILRAQGEGLIAQNDPCPPLISFHQFALPNERAFAAPAYRCVAQQRA